jgi:putative DNA primase/helicase
LLTALSNLPFSDAGNAEGFVHMYGRRFRFDHRRGHGGLWLRWNGLRWEPDELGQSQRAAISLARARLAAAASIDSKVDRKRAIAWAKESESRSRIASMLSLSGNYPPLTTITTMYDNDPWLLSCGNGTLDLENGKLYPSIPSDMMTRGTLVEYYPGAAAPRWHEFLKEVFADNQELIGFIRRAFGYCLTGDIREQVLFLCYGLGANGKGTMFNIMRAVLGTHAADTSFGTFEITRNESTNDLASICGCRLVTASETNESKRLNEARIKAITGRDPVTCRFLYNEFFTYNPTYKVWLAMNHKPEIRGTDRGIWRRVRLIPFTVSFEGREDKTLEDKLRAELPGILSWAVQGCLEWQRDGMATPTTITDATEEYRRESDLVGRFLDEKTQAMPLGEIPASTLYGAFASWCKSNGEEVMTNTAFGRRMTERGVTKKHETTGWHYEKLAFTPELEEMRA